MKIEIERGKDYSFAIRKVRDDGTSVGIVRNLKAAQILQALGSTIDDLIGEESTREEMVKALTEVVNKVNLPNAVRELAQRELESLGCAGPEAPAT